jgi:hypothetical protein
MARTIEECNAFILSNLVTEFAAIGITINPATWSKRNFLRVICYVFAIAQSVTEQMYDVAIAKMQAIQNVSAAATALWLQDAVFRFQYSTTTPQNLIIVNNVPTYAVVNPNLRIVTACSVNTTVTNQVNIKVAKGVILGALSVAEKAALQTYILSKGTAGITYNVISNNPDRVYLNAEIYYAGTYSTVIQQTVIDALNNFLTNLSKVNFNGNILISDVENLIRNVAGVNDVVIQNMQIRESSQTVLLGTPMVVNGDWINRKMQFAAGYGIQEDTATYTFADTLNLIAE